MHNKDIFVDKKFEKVIITLTILKYDREHCKNWITVHRMIYTIRSHF